MKAGEVKGFKDEELRLEEQRLRRQLFDLKCQSVTEKLENPKQMKNLRRDIARLLTEQSSRRKVQDV